MNTENYLKSLVQQLSHSNLTEIPFVANKYDYGYRAFFLTKSGKFKLSVVAGDLYYSTPREDLANPKDYTHVELAVFNPDGTWSQYNELAEVFEILGEKGEHVEDELGITRKDVFCEIPIDKIMELYNKL